MQKKITLTCLGLLILLGVGYFSPSMIFVTAADLLEPNDTQETAQSITAGTYAGMELVDGEYDWYKITVPAKRLINITLDFTCPDLDEMVYLYLKNEETNTLDYDLIYPYEIGNAFIFLMKETTVFIKIYPYWGYDDSTYTLTVAVTDPTTDPKFTYGVEVDDELQYTVTSTIDITATDNFYTKVGNLLKNVTGGDDVVFVSGFSLKSFIQDMENFLKEPIDIQLTISDLFNADIFTEDNMSQDYITGDVRTDIDGDWKLPSEYLIARSTELSNLVEPYFDPTFFNESVEEYFDSINEVATNMTEVDFNDVPLMQTTYVNDIAYYLDMLNLTLEDDTKFPVPPNNHYLPINGMSSFMGAGLSLAQLCFPTDFSFKAYYDWGLDVYDFMEAYLNETEGGSPLSNYTFAEYLDIAGISTFYVDTQSIGITWSSTAVDLAAIADLVGITEDELHDEIEEMLLDVSIDYNASSASVSMALEYDPEMVLASYVFYIDMTVKINSTAMDIPEDFDINDETVSISWSESIVKEGLEPPTEEEIQNGDIGENRDLVPGFQIPGYPLLLLGLISIIAIIPVLKRNKQKTI